MKARLLFWTGRRASSLPVKEVLTFSEFSEDVFDEFTELFKNAVAQGVAEVVEQIEF